ncbi:MAG: hypothetical protein WCW52_12125 [Elusimicrobiales bacterium]
MKKILITAAVFGMTGAAFAVGSNSPVADLKGLAAAKVDINSPEPRPAAVTRADITARITVSEEISTEVKELIKKALLDNRARILKLDPSISIAFDEHYNPRNPMVNLRSQIGAAAFYLHQAKEIRYATAPLKMKPALFFGTSTDPDTMDIYNQVEAVITAAEFVTLKINKMP